MRMYVWVRMDGLMMMYVLVELLVDVWLYDGFDVCMSMYGRMAVCMGGLMYVRMRMYVLMMGVWIDGLMAGWVYGWTDGRTYGGGWMYG